MPTMTTTPLTGTWMVDASASTVGFAVRHLGIATVRGTFAAFRGGLDAGASGISAGGQVDVASVDTGSAIRDGRLRDEFFAVDAFPHARIAWTDPGRELRAGRRVVPAELTLRGVTRAVPVDVTIERAGADRLRVKLDADVRRSEFGLEWDALREAGRRLVADRVRVLADLELTRTA